MSSFADEALYRLPYDDGEAFTISQAPGGMMTTHATRDSRHAVDFKMPEGTRVVAARDGVVIAVEWRHARSGSRGELRSRSNYVRVRHADGTFAIYGHLEHAGVSVEEGEWVWAGRGVGYSGMTGYSSAPHLHFGVTQLDESQGVEVSIPVMFYNGDPPAAFIPRVGLSVRASYTVPLVPMPQPVTRVAARSVLDDHWRPEPPPPPTQDLIAQGWVRIYTMFVLGIAGIAWFFWFSRD